MSIRNMRYWEPVLDIRPVRGFPAQIAQDLRDRLISFELEDNAKLVDKASMTLDNGDGRLLVPEALAFGVWFNISFGYVGSLSPPRFYQVRKISGALRVGGLGALSGPNTQAGGAVNFDMRTKLWNFNLFRGASGNARQNRQLRFEGRTKTDVVRALAARNGFVGNSLLVEDLQSGEPVEEEIVIPAFMSDAEWIRNEARERAWVFAVDAGGLHFHSPDYELGADAEELVWFAGDPDIIKWSIDGDLNVPDGIQIAGTTDEEVRVGTFSSTPGQQTGTGSNTGEDAESETGTSQEYTATVSLNAPRQTSGQQTITGEQVANTPVPDRKTLARVERSINASMKRWKLKLELVGNPRIHGHRKLLLKNFGPLIDGLWYIKVAKHTYTAGDVYRTTIEANRRNIPGAGRTQVRVGITEEVDGYRTTVSLISGPPPPPPRRRRRRQRSDE